MSSPVVVGVDGSRSSLAAVQVAAREAQRRGVGLRLAHAIGWTSDHVPSGVPPWDSDGTGLRASVNGMLARAERRARDVAPDVEISSDVLVGEPATVLEIESRSASLAVVGSHVTEGLLGRLHGSVAGHLAAHGRCPVLVVRGKPEPSGSVVVEVDGSPASQDAVAFAFAEASQRGVDLVAFHVPNTRNERADGAPAEGLSGLQVTYPDVAVHRRPVRGSMRSALVGASADAQLVVVGARDRDGLAKRLRGAVGHAVIQRAHCPVAVVRSEKE